MAHDVFVSHSVKDKLVADSIVAESVRCWVAPRDVVPGADWGESIVDAIESSRIMILIFSKNANESRQIKREVERAVDKGVYIIPFRVDDIEPTKSLEYFISTAQWMDAFPPPLERHLDDLACLPGAGTFNWRKIAGTERRSNHSFGTAIDLNVNKAAYWRWQTPAQLTTFSRKNWPNEIVEAFERHGFIWGGKWWHFDTMHFEYRPEIIAYAKANPAPNPESKSPPALQPPKR